MSYTAQPLVVALCDWNLRLIGDFKEEEFNEF